LWYTFCARPRASRGILLRPVAMDRIPTQPPSLDDRLPSALLRTPVSARHMKRWTSVGVLLVAAALLFVPAQAQESSLTAGPPTRRLSTPEPEPDDLLAEGESGWISERLLPRLIPENPTQADLGAQDYYQICMACHGDRGQGLTDEWREAWGDDSYCWESKCHAANHPPQGFALPHTIGPVLGAGSLLAYPTALDLFQKIRETMPWWNPGSLTDEQSLQLTAYLLRERAEMPPGLMLDTGNAAVVQLHLQPTPRGNEQQLALGLGGLLAVAGLAVALRRRPPH